MSRSISAIAVTLLGVASQAVAAQQVSFPQGTFIAHEALDPRAVSRNAGVEFDFVEGRYEVRRDDELRVRGHYILRGDTITITEAEGPWACTGAAASANYAWLVAADRLVLTLVGEDACNRRRNRLSGVVLLSGRAPPLAKTVSAPPDLAESWRRFWLESEVPGWIEDVFAPAAIARDGDRILNGIDEIRQWLGGQDSRDPQAFPFEFSRVGREIIERGRYRDIFGSPDGSTRVLVGRYQITWVPMESSKWKVGEWILR
ncbi:MAG TPA: hypothetical protein VJ820_19760 [Propionibacteriaceae bacterium]|nr:hypothetical protein [Propionibacteriaceae bacterium]